MPNAEKVRNANKEFYNEIADIYEKIDTRRSEEISFWIDDIIKNLIKNKNYKSFRFLDIACGTGLMMKYGKKYFKYVYGVDLSSKVLKTAKKYGNVVCADINSLPFKNDSINFISCFATLHHCYTFYPVLKEAYRVMKKDGIIYIDHDLDLEFMKRFYRLVKFYRLFFDMGKGYLRNKKALSRELYELTEYHSDGVSHEKIKEDMEVIGFKNIRLRYHMWGINKVSNAVMRLTNGNIPKFIAPLVSITAEK